MQPQPRKAPLFKAGEDVVQRYYLSLVPLVRLAAYPCGYAIAIHGSARRDLDVIAVPWTADAKPAEVLVDKVLRYLNGEYEYLHDNKAPYDHPHGRKVWTLMHRRGKYFIDFGVMPRLEKGK